MDTFSYLNLIKQDLQKKQNNNENICTTTSLTIEGSKVISPNKQIGSDQQTFSKIVIHKISIIVVSYKLQTFKFHYPQNFRVRLYFNFTSLYTSWSDVLLMEVQ